MRTHSGPRVSRAIVWRHGLTCAAAEKVLRHRLVADGSLPEPKTWIGALTDMVLLT